MNKNRFILILSLLSGLLATMAVSRPYASIPTAEKLNGPPRPAMFSAVDSMLLSDYHERQAALARNSVDLANDFYQRHTDWAGELNNDFNQKYPGKWVSRAAGVAIPVTSSSAASDYFQRHTELLGPAGVAVDVTDYFLRHPERNAPTENIDLSDYILRH